ncbi:hypothetical protein CRUP_017966 [Coryphaenoides rupestris]|nr:hypothetical protein CRUP_017966 [Coryphaenoides rupestris]
MKRKEMKKREEREWTEESRVSSSSPASMAGGVCVSFLERFYQSLHDDNRLVAAWCVEMFVLSGVSLAWALALLLPGHGEALRDGECEGF